MGSNAYGNTGPLPTPACLGYRDNTRGGKPSPPTVTPVQHAGALEESEQARYYHCSVRQRGRMEDMVNGGIGDARDHKEGLSGLWKTSYDGHLFQIPGIGIDCGGWQLDRGGREPLEVEEELSTTGEDSGTLGRHLKGLGDIFQGGSAIGAFIWVGDVGDETPHGTGTGKLPVQYHHEDNGEAA